MSYVVKMMSQADGEKLYAKIGRWLGSPTVRRECGGYPLNDGETYIWLVAMNKRDLTPCGFISFEHGACVVLHHGYVDPAHRSKGVFGELLRQCLAYADHHHLSISTTQQGKSSEALAKHGFAEVGRRGAWIKLERSAK